LINYTWRYLFALTGEHSNSCVRSVKQFEIAHRRTKRIEKNKYWMHFSRKC
jgi:hypothetical protein